MNFINGVFDGKRFVVTNEEEKVEITLNENIIKAIADYRDKELVLGIRPDDIYLNDDKKNSNVTGPLSLACDISELLGREYIIYTFVAGQRIIIKTSSNKEILSGNINEYCFDLDKIHFFDKETTLKVY